MAEVRPFRALGYGERAGPLEELVAPPFDVISPAEREQLLARSPHNVVHLTLPDSEEQAARDLTAWRRDEILVRDDEPSFWALSQRYVGPDGVERTRNGIVASLRAEPYERGVVLPHERTHAGPKEGRLRLLRALRTQLEPIFLLHEGDPVELPRREPDLEVGGDRLWRVDDGRARLDARGGPDHLPHAPGRGACRRRGREPPRGRGRRARAPRGGAGRPCGRRPLPGRRRSPPPGRGGRARH